jgi:hypothetical protein
MEYLCWNICIFEGVFSKDGLLLIVFGGRIVIDCTGRYNHRRLLVLTIVGWVLTIGFNYCSSVGYYFLYIDIAGRFPQLVVSIIVVFPSPLLLVVPSPLLQLIISVSLH